MKGTATISLADLKELERLAETGEKAILAANELGSNVHNMLAHMAKVLDMEKFSDHYNASEGSQFEVKLTREGWRLLPKS